MKTEDSYLARINTVFLGLLAAHVPAMCAVAAYFGTGVMLAAALSLLFVAGPALLYYSDRGGKLTSVALASATMCFSALLIHLSGGMAEMHFHIFTMLALAIAYRFPWPLVAAAATIAVHHIAFFLWMPQSLFSYQATFGIVLMHAFFVVFEVVPALWLTHMLSQSAESAEKNQNELKGMVGGVRGAITEIEGSAQALATVSAGLSADSGSIGQGTRDASQKARTVSDSAARMRSMAAAVASGMDDTASRLNSVACATEQMTATIGEIAQNSEKARRITGEAAHRTTQVTAQMNQLSNAVQAIGKITEAITEISSQTNLLALNATIEAARAGASGKGFSVVAAEIKALAHQTQQATEDIKARIEGLRTTATGGIEEIGRISGVVEEVNGLVSSIAAAIEQQSATTKDISRNIVDASHSVRDANEKASQTSRESGEIESEIAGVNRISGDLARGSDQLLSNSDQVSAVAVRIQQGMGQLHAFCESYDRFVAESR